MGDVAALSSLRSVAERFGRTVGQDTTDQYTVEVQMDPALGKRTADHLVDELGLPGRVHDADNAPRGAVDFVAERNADTQPNSRRGEKDPHGNRLVEARARGD